MAEFVGKRSCLKGIQGARDMEAGILLLRNDKKIILLIKD